MNGFICCFQLGHISKLYLIDVIKLSDSIVVSGAYWCMAISYALRLVAVSLSDWCHGD
jgi:hypothetical protein